MNRKKNIIANAIIWASVILATAIIAKDLSSDSKSMLLLIHVVGWLFVSKLISDKEPVQK